MNIKRSAAEISDETKSGRNEINHGSFLRIKPEILNKRATARPTKTEYMRILNCSKTEKFI